MNDEFLHRLRKEPRAAFARQLQARLLRQDPLSDQRFDDGRPRSRAMRRLVLMFLILGAAYAGGYLAMKRVPAVREFFGVHSETASMPGTEVAKVAPSGGRPGPIEPVVPAVDESIGAQMQSASDARAPVAVLPQSPLVAEPVEPGGISSSSVRSVGAGSDGQQTREVIRIIASTPVYSMTKAVADDWFGNRMRYGGPLVDRMAVGEDLRAFCKGVGVDEPDLLATSRLITGAEAEACARNGVDVVVGLKIGYRSIVVARTAGGGPTLLTPREIFLAVAKQVPDRADPTRLVDNPYRNWRQVNPQLEDQYIEAYGPAGGVRRDDFAEVVMEAGCNTFPALAALKNTDPTLYNVTCHAVREDGVYMEAQETADLIPQKLGSAPNAVAIVGYAFYKRNERALIGNVLGGVDPSLQRIGSGSYAGSRTLYLYVKKAHIGMVPRLRAFLLAYTSDRIIGPDGLLAREGFISMEEGDRRATRTDVSGLN